MNRKTPKTQQSNSSVAKVNVASCAISVSAGNEIQLFPAGEFRASDGRPKDAPHWLINAELAAAIIADFEARQNKTVIDYEHQTLLTTNNGQPAPAAAWFSKLEWRESGLYAIDVEWTQRATDMIEGGEYKYISPVFTYDKKTGAITSVLNAALTNNPALDGMDAVAANQFLQLDNSEVMNMSLLEQLRWMLNLAVTATEEEVISGLQKAIDQIKAAATSAASAPGFDIVALIKSQADQIASLTVAAANPDPAKFIAIAAMKSIQDELTTLKAKELDREINEVVQEALRTGKLLPAQEEWARSLGNKDLAFLKSFVDSAQPIAALAGTQTGGVPPVGGGKLDVNNSKAVATAARKYQLEQESQGVMINTAQAVNHVTQLSVGFGMPDRCKNDLKS